MSDDDNDGLNDPKKYIVGKNDFRRLPRWQNDGIEQHQKEESQDSNNNATLSHEAIESASPLHRELAGLLGNWVYESLSKSEHEVSTGDASEDIMPDEFVLCLPIMMQQKAAMEQLNLEAAQEHLIHAYQDQDRNPEVHRILGEIGYRPAIFKASRDRRRFPDWKALICKLLQMNFGTDKNIKLLFGEVSYVRGLLLTVGQVVAEPPPPNTPAYAIWNPILNQNDFADRVKPVCAYCEKEEGVGAVSKLSKCSSCKSVYYCSKDCQRTHWPVHRPECLEKQGKPVPEKAREKAVATLAKWEREKKDQKEESYSRYCLEVEQLFQQYRSEEPGSAWSHDCYGNRLHHDFPLHGENLFRLVASENGKLKFEKEIELGMFPEGMEHISEETRGLGFLVSDKVSKGKIIILYERLFANQGNGDFNGLGLFGMWVVDRSVTQTERGQRVQRAVWKKVDEPSAGDECNRYQRVAGYLERARAQAKAVPQQVDLGIHDVKAQMETIQQIETPFGQYMKGFGGVL